MMPDSQNHNRLGMRRIPNNIFPEYCITHRLWVGRESHSSSHLRKKANILDAMYKLGRHSGCCNRLFAGNKCAESSQISNGVF